MSATVSIAISAVLACAVGQAAAKHEARPNLLVIIVDDLGYGDLSCYGATDLQTPNIDALVADGMRFDRFYASCPVCSPTRAALLTGRYPEYVGVPGVIRTHASNNWGWLNPDVTLLPAVLKPLGYHTAIIGKWHLGLEPPNIPTRRGFDLFRGFLGDMMDDYYTHRRHGINYMRHNEREIDPKGHATDLFTQWACEYIEERAADGKPFFLYLAYNAPHTPIQPPQQWLQRVLDREKGIDQKRAKLVALIEQLDYGIGKVVAKLKTTGLYDRTLIVFTSDNGGQLAVGANNGSLRGGKQDMYEGGIRVPTAVVWPGHIKPGSRTDCVAITMDLFPTLVDAAGGRSPACIDGVTLLPVLLGEADQLPGPRYLFWGRREGGRRYQGLITHAVRYGPWKLVYNSPFAPFELYNLDQDPQEKHNVANKYPRVFNNLAAALRRHIQRSGQVPWQPPNTHKM